MAKMGLSEILKKTSEQPEAERGEYLRRNWNPTLGILIRYAYDSEFDFNLPEGTPPYKVNIHLDQESNLYNETRRLYLFLRGAGDHVDQKRKEMLFIQLLENLSKADAELLIAVKDGELPYGITQEFIIAELPGQLVNPRSKEDTMSAETFQDASATIVAPAEPEASTAIAETETTEPVVEPTPKRASRKPAAKKPGRKPVAKTAKKTVAKKAVSNA